VAYVDHLPGDYLLSALSYLSKQTLPPSKDETEDIRARVDDWNKARDFIPGFKLPILSDRLSGEGPYILMLLKTGKLVKLALRTGK